MNEQEITKDDYKLIGKIVRCLHEYYNTSSNRELHEIIFTEFHENASQSAIEELNRSIRRTRRRPL